MYLDSGQPYHLRLCKWTAGSCSFQALDGITTRFLLLLQGAKGGVTSSAVCSNRPPGAPWGGTCGTGGPGRLAAAAACRYKQEGKWKEKQQPRPRQQASRQQQQPKKQQHKQRHGRHITYAHACLQTHFLAGEERFRVEWDQTDDSVW
jgi:hypothetical protein